MAELPTQGKFHEVDDAEADAVMRLLLIRFFLTKPCAE